jgi:hypothetical protein
LDNLPGLRVEGYDPHGPLGDVSDEDKMPADAWERRTAEPLLVKFG